MKLDNDKIDKAVLALLLLGLHDGARAWKGFDWDSLNRLYEKGCISDPRGKAKSIVFTEEGLRQAERLLEELFFQHNGTSSQPANTFTPLFGTIAFRNRQSNRSRSKRL